MTAACVLLVVYALADVGHSDVLKAGGWTRRVLHGDQRTVFALWITFDRSLWKQTTMLPPTGSVRISRKVTCDRTYGLNESS